MIKKLPKFLEAIFIVAVLFLAAGWLSVLLRALWVFAR
jgi:hypothetical protein